jgi:hypothetical protein
MLLFDRLIYIVNDMRASRTFFPHRQPFVRNEINTKTASCFSKRLPFRVIQYRTAGAFFISVAI